MRVFLLLFCPSPYIIYCNRCTKVHVSSRPNRITIVTMVTSKKHSCFEFKRSLLICVDYVNDCTYKELYRYYWKSLYFLSNRKSNFFRGLTAILFIRACGSSVLFRHRLYKQVEFHPGIIRCPLIRNVYILCNFHIKNDFSDCLVT